MKGDNYISDELIAAYLDGRTDAVGTIMVLRAAKEDHQLMEYLNFAKSLDGPTAIDNGILPMTSLAAEDHQSCGCDIKCELYLLRRFGYDSSYQELEKMSLDNGWLTEGGIPLHNMGRILENKGLSTARRYFASIDDIKEALNEGMEVLVAVDGGELNGDAEEEADEDIAVGKIPDHAVVVMMVDRQEDEVMIYDPRCGEIPVSVPTGRFMDAWDDSSRLMITVTSRENRASHYHPSPIRLDDVEIDGELTALREAIAENAHEVWAAGRMAEGWSYGPQRDDKYKLHPDLLPYSDLTESEKEYDRETAMNTIKLLIKLGYLITKRH